MEQARNVVSASQECWSLTQPLTRPLESYFRDKITNGSTITILSSPSLCIPTTIVSTYSRKPTPSPLYYTMKYISKAEDNTHSKALTVTSAVAKALSASNNGHDQGRSMLIKTYNKSRHREVGIPDAISHLLDYSDVLTGATFQNIYTTHLLNHLRRSTMGRTISHQWTLETIIRKFRPSVT
jgi:hypothetical protein